MTYDFTSEGPGTYDVCVTVTNELGNVEECCKEVTVNPALSLECDVSPNPTKVGHEVQFDSTITGGVGPYDILWDFGDGIGTSTEEDPLYTYSTAGSYTATVTVTDSLGNVETCEIPMIVEPPLDVTCSVDPTTAMVGEEVQFQSTITGGVGPYDILWDFGDGVGTSTEEDPTYTYSAVGTYNACVTVVDSLGNTEECCVPIEITGGFGKEFTNPMVLVGSDWVPLADWHIANGGTGDEEWVPLFTEVKWTVTYYVPNDIRDTMYSAVLKDRFGAELDQAEPGQYTASHGTVTFEYSKGKMKQLRLTWDIGDLANGETATLSFDVVTKENPAGKQEYTSPGLHILNSGAVLKWRDALGHQDSMSTPSCYVMAGNTLGAIVGVVTDGAGNPVSGATVEWWETGGLVPIDTATTDEHGFYYFPEVTPDDGGTRYQVKYGVVSVPVGVIMGGEIVEIALP